MEEFALYFAVYMCGYIYMAIHVVYSKFDISKSNRP